MLVCSARDYYGDSEAVPNSNKTRQKEVEHTTQGKCVHSVPIKYAPALVNNCEFLIYPWEKITAFRFRSCNHVQAFSPGSVHSATQVLKLYWVRSLFPSSLCRSYTTRALFLPCGH